MKRNLATKKLNRIFDYLLAQAETWDARQIVARAQFLSILEPAPLTFDIALEDVR